MNSLHIDDDGHSNPVSGRRSFTWLVGVSMIGAAAFCVATNFLHRRKFSGSTDAANMKSAIKDDHRDKILEDTFPASDPPASQYFDIPVNRL